MSTGKRTIKKRLLTMLLCVCMALCLLPTTALAADPDLATYTELATYVTANSNTLPTGSYKVTADYSSPLIIGAGATVTIYVAEEVTLTCSDPGNNKAAIRVPEGAELTIEGKGTVKATGGSGGAGIGGGGFEKVGTINIHGCTVNATGGNGGAGIGCASGGQFTSGVVNISGGVVIATGRSMSAGIGGGQEHAVSEVNISGGVVTATGDHSGAGIGGGYKHGGGTVRISGGVVTAISDGAHGAGGAAGIGGGGGDSSSNGGNGGTVIISGGTVKATGNHGGAGIGGGGGNPANPSGYPGGAGANVTITGGTVFATGGADAPAIGSGYGWNTANSAAALNPNSGTLTNGSGTGVSLVTLTLTGAADGTPIGSFVTDATSYLLTDVQTIDDTLYFYLPAGHSITSVTTDETAATIYTDPNPSATSAGITLTKNAYAITNTLTNITNSNTAAYRLSTETADYTATLSVGSGYTLPATITVKVGGAELADTAYTYANGSLSIPAASITGDIEIIAAGISAAPAPLTIYPISAGTGETWSPGSAEGQSFTSDGPFARFLSAAVDGKAITRNVDYTASAGSTVITLQPAYLQTLAMGDHTLRLNFDGGYSTATFTIGAPLPRVNPFKDVKEGDWFYEAVMYVAENGLMQGTKTDEFSPYEATSRAMVVTTLWRMASEPQATGKNNFPDVEKDKWYTEAVIWAAENGVAKGYDNGLFGTNDPVSREQLATFFYNYAKYKGYDMTISGSLDTFTDKGAISDYAVDAMKWAVGSGLIAGKPGKLLDPQGKASRAEFAAMLHRFIK